MIYKYINNLIITKNAKMVQPSIRTSIQSHSLLCKNLGGVPFLDFGFDFYVFLNILGVL